MIVKKYLVKDIKEALEKIKIELGKDAVILGTRKIKKGGFLGIGAKTYLEVTAAVEENELKQNQESKNQQIYQLQEILSKNSPKKDSDDLDEIKKMMYELKSMVSRQRSDNEPEWIINLRKALNFHDVNQEIIEKVIEYIRIKYGNIDFNDENTRFVLSEIFLPFIKTETPDILGKVMFVGPTGVGKTTTLAKLAAKMSINENKKVGILTLDTYRIAATEQLKTYATLMDIPMRVAYTPKEARIELEAMSDFDVVFIDTAGRSQKNELQMNEIKAMSEIISPDYKFLVVGMQYRSSDLELIAKKFSEISPTHIILTKMDETSSLGHFLNTSHFINKPIIYITNGQRVPDDIIEASNKELSILLSREVLKYVKSS
ncbi:flagellar biosynthesis regulator FlhF [Thermosipho sp. 1063]|uniref:flagellar biosynthesis protein FlhF n=1 Tax=unclassified Thermosipho (in: thermotogales) TaxID=2676525 RepID=UPI0009492C30|nr:MULTISPECIES: flagellar biosynthesis protein FlhF [unclassified Thermosipho (in: thermotogales)]ANQ54319.1 flagellar biosynthesis regulator FlhF [Thermosipho sp. 1070]APT72764.1 flagellar biosynthesis regulator FlhF [Thermosipho sp. 1063]OOC42202.1 flagellar biosynthesis regulator FlhF [Thermosipho sp. 1074]